jgi:uncharacterized protein (TIGR03437 family)
MKAAPLVGIFLGLCVGAMHATGTDFSTILGGTGQDYATSVASDAQKNVYVVGLTYSSDFPVTQGSVQTTFGGTSDAFIAKLSPAGKLIWATYLGGILDDWATGVALDSAGNVLVTGYTRSANFPLANPAQGILDNGASPDNYDAFVAKLSPDGAKLLYSTFLGGSMDDAASGIAIDSGGNAYVAVSVPSAAGFPGIENAPAGFGVVVSKLDPQGAVVYSFFHPNGSAAAVAVDAAGSAYVAGTVDSALVGSAAKIFGPPGSMDAFVFKISPDGSHKAYETVLGGSSQASATAIAVDTTGQAYVAGSTSSVDFPLVHPFQSSPGARPLWKSTNGGTSWTPLDNLPFAIPQMIVADPSAPNTLYAATGDLGVFKSVDGGVTWVNANTGITGTNVQALAIDPVHLATLYASVSGAKSNAIYKSVDAASHWTLVDSAAPSNSLLAVDAQSPAIVWEIGASLKKTTDGGITWNSVAFPGTIQSMVLDPRVSGHLFAVSQLEFCGSMCGGAPPYLYRSVDGGANWIQVSSVRPNPPLVVDASTNPSTVYDGLVSRSIDGGVTWSPETPPPVPNPSSSLNTLAVDTGGALYAAIAGMGMYVSHDHAQTWTATGSFIPPWPLVATLPVVASIVPSGSNGVLYAATNQVTTSGFVTKLSTDGSSIAYSTYLGGHAAFEPYVTYAAEPAEFYLQNAISGIAIDAAGNATVAGITRATDFPVVSAAQGTKHGIGDAFVATILADGSGLNYSTYFGGSQDDGALAVTLDSQGSAIFAGQTWSADFPVPGGVQPAFDYGNAFVVKLAAPGPPAINSVVNGASYQAGIEAGSWVTIEGVNLANTFPGRTWRSDEIVDGNLPASLDGVSVTIDDKPAFVYYISPTQINVQAPSDSAVGPVKVLVDNNGNASPDATAQLQTAAPAFFMYLGTNYAVTSLLPGYTLVADPSVVPGAVAAKPGDTLVLWGTGFGATNPEVAAGVAVSGAPAVVTALTVTVGGVATPVLSTVLSTGFVGLYQVTIQLPSTVPTGAVAIQAFVGGQATPAGALLFVRKP